MIALFDTIIYNPLYNGLVFLIDVIPGHDVGLAVILLTIIVRTILYPLARKAVKSQMAMKTVAPEVEELKKKHKDNASEQGTAIMKLYRERGVSPFAGLGVMIVQIPILIALYLIFSRGGLPAIHSELLYVFVAVPSSVQMLFLGLFDMGASHNIFLAVCTAATQMVYARLSMGPRPGKTAVEESLSADMARSFDLQARYIIPIVIGVVAYSVASAAGLYYTVGNIYMIAQEYLAGRRFRA